MRVLFVLVCLLSIPTSASAECAWVLWSRVQLPENVAKDTWQEWSGGDAAYPTYSKCWERIRAYSGIPEEGSLSDWSDWMRGRGRYDVQMRTKDIFRLPPGDKYIAATENGALLLSADKGVEFRCLPDTADPRGAKGK